MKLGILLAAILFTGAVQAQQSTDGSSWYVLIGEHSQPWSLCYAKVVAEGFKDGAYVEAKAAEDAKRDKEAQCKLIPPTADEKKAQDECHEAQKNEKLARERVERHSAVAGVEPLSAAEARTRSACEQVLLPRVAGGRARCNIAITNLKRSQVLTVTKRLGPYPTAERASDELRAGGWRTGISPASGDEIWFKKDSCK